MGMGPLHEDRGPPSQWNSNRFVADFAFAIDFWLEPLLEPCSRRSPRLTSIFQYCDLAVVFIE